MNTTLVGLDLGTMNAAGVTSRGVRRHLPSEVGWPKDVVARHVIGREALFGDELEVHRKALITLRPFEKGSLKFGSLTSNDEAKAETQRRVSAAIELLCHLRAILEIPEDHHTRAVLGVPCEASLQNRAVLLKIASTVFDQVLLLPEPFALAYGLASRKEALKEALIVDIGAGTIDFCHYYGGLPEASDQASIAWGGDYIDADFHQRVCAAHPDIRFSPAMARAVKEKHGAIGPDTRAVPVRVPGKDNQQPVTIDVARELSESCSLLAAEIVRGIQQLLAQADPLSHSSLLRNIVLGGGGSQIAGLDRVIEQMLADYGPVRATRLYDTRYAGANGALQLAMEIPEQHWQSIATAKAA